jgi:hypothetical protein
VLKTGTGLTIGSAGVGDCKERSRTSFCDAGVCAAAAGVAIGAGAGVCATGVGVTGAAAAFGVGGVPPRGAPAIGALVEEVEEVEEVEPEEFGLYVLKNSIQDGSSEVGSDK